jgi:ABC-type maltose transport system permease subunit
VNVSVSAPPVGSSADTRPERQPARRPARQVLGKAGGHLLMLLTGLVAIVPLLLMLRVALTPASDWRTMPIDWFREPFWDSFSQVLSGSFPRSLLNSFVIATVTTAVVTCSPRSPVTRSHACGPSARRTSCSSC